MHSILITRQLSEVPRLEAFCKSHDLLLQANSFIRFAPVKAEIPDQMEALFFGSSRALDFFLLQAVIPPGCKIACIGEATANHIRQRGYEVSFTGKKSGEPDSVAQELKAWLGTRKLHIAQSVQSNRSMAKALPASQTDSLIVYDTMPDAKTISLPFDWMVFTSPSNLESFLVLNSIPEKTRLIAWGKTTANAMESKGMKADFVLEHASEMEVIAILNAHFLKRAE